MASRIKPEAGFPLSKPRSRKQKSHRKESSEHLAFVRTLPCLASGLTGRIEAHHLTVGRYRMGRKMDDDCVVPLTASLHQGGAAALHSMGERKFWNRRGVDPRPVAQFLWDNSGDHDACVEHIRKTLYDANTTLRSGRKIFEEK